MPSPLQFLSPLHKATRQIGIHLAVRMKALGLSNPEGHLLGFLRAYAPASVGHLLRVFGHKPSTLTSMLDRLEERGLVRRSPNPADRRSYLVQLSAAGRRLADQARRPVEELEQAIAHGVSRQDLAGFRSVMTAIEEATSVSLPAQEKSR